MILHIEGNDMKIAIVGAGGVGGYFGGRLAQAGNDVTFIARGNHYDAIKKNGLKVKSTKGDFEINPASVESKISELKELDLVLVSVKAWQVKEVAKELSQVLAKNTIVLPLQNGVLAAKELKEILQANNVINGLCRIFSKIEEPGVITHMSAEPTIIFGECNNSKSERIRDLKDLFSKANITAKNPDDIDVELWKKFILICLSGLCAVTNSAHGPIREIPETREMMIELLTEVYKVGKASGVNLKNDLVAKIMKNVDEMDYNATSSLTRDVWEGRPSEIEYQNGTVVKLGNQLGVPTPINKFVYNCVLPMEKLAREK